MLEQLLSQQFIFPLFIPVHKRTGLGSGVDIFQRSKVSNTSIIFKLKEDASLGLGPCDQRKRYSASVR